MDEACVKAAGGLIPEERCVCLFVGLSVCLSVVVGYGIWGEEGEPSWVQIMYDNN